ncbi:MAG: DUF1549 domain-containing protein [Planctomycetes bacterium]|nr:DUF1549 domain-containing protein [Planctomycetota bacterium]
MRTLPISGIAFFLLFAIRALLPLALCAQGDEPERDASREEMQRRIAMHLEARWTEAGIPPAERCSDEEFCRRSSLDLCGVIPRVAEVREFLADNSANKRSQWLERLLASPAHATHLASTWRNVMLPGGTDLEQLQNAVGVQNWLRAQFVDNVRYDRMVSELLVATSGAEAGPALFYTSLELQPEKLAAATARIFLGLQMECAQCHNHPFDHWKQEDFWGYAAFFARTRQVRGNRMMARLRLEDLDSGDVKIPNTETIVTPKFPNGLVAPDDSGTRRERLSIWMASRDNPYLARAVVNRVWAQLFGRGIVDPVDDLGVHNPPSHPQLLEELTHYFVNCGFDLRALYRLLTGSRAYQLSSVCSSQREPPPELFSRMQLKPLSAEQFYDSLARLFPPSDSGMAGIPQATGLFNPRRLSFLGRMQNPSKNSLDYQAGILQALTLLNGAELHSASHPDQSSLLGALNSPLFTRQDRIEVIYLATLARRPSDEERRISYEYLEGGAAGDAQTAFADLVWAILNSAEFAMNH